MSRKKGRVNQPTEQDLSSYDWDIPDSEVISSELTNETVTTEFAVPVEPVIYDVSFEDVPTVVMEEEFVTVSLVTTDVYRTNFFLVYNVETKEARFVPVDSVKYTVKPQKLLKRVFEIGDKPYDWEEEIEALLVSKSDLKLALWRTGLVEHKKLDFKEIIARLLRSGKLPIRS